MQCALRRLTCCVVASWPSSGALVLSSSYCGLHPIRSTILSNTCCLPSRLYNCHPKRQVTVTPTNNSSSETSAAGGKTENTAETSLSPDEVSSLELIEELRKAMNELESQLTKMEEKCKDLQDKLLRALAENENSRTRYLKEIETSKLFGITKFAESILEVADNLQRAIESSSMSSNHNNSSPDFDRAASAVHSNTALLEGVKMTQSVLNNCLSNVGIIPFDPTGQLFDPKLHEALFELNCSDHPKGTVIQVLKQGYMIKDRVLRPAKVGTSRGP